MKKIYHVYVEVETTVRSKNTSTLYIGHENKEASDYESYLTDLDFNDSDDDCKKMFYKQEWINGLVVSIYKLEKNCFSTYIWKETWNSYSIWKEGIEKSLVELKENCMLLKKTSSKNDENKHETIYKTIEQLETLIEEI